MHECTGMALMSVPMVLDGQRADVRLVERGDYVGREDIRLDAEGRAHMRAEVEHADGHVDVFVYAPTAHMGVSAG